MLFLLFRIKVHVKDCRYRSESIKMANTCWLCVAERFRFIVTTWTQQIHKNTLHYQVRNTFNIRIESNCECWLCSSFVHWLGYNENYSAYYERRSRDKDQCMHDEHDQWEDPSIPSGQTVFTKVRIDLHSLQVVIDDYTFSRTSGRRRQPFATAGDCFSSTQQCPRGVFSINFEKTKFRIRPKTRWETRGMNSTQQFAGPGVSA